MKILVAVPCMDTTPVGFTLSLVDMLTYSQKLGDDIKLCMHTNSLVYDSRNLLSLTAIEQNFDYVLWLDSDMVFPPDLIEYMLGTMDILGDIDMLTEVYYMRKPPHSPVLYSVIDEPELKDGQVQKKIQTMTNIPDSLFTVEGCGFGCVMTKVSLLKEVWDKFGPAFTPYPWASEDMSFCYRVKQLGKKIWCDSVRTIGHIGTAVFDKTNIRKVE